MAKEKKVFVYVLEDGRLYGKEVKEKELESQVYYTNGEIIVVNKDYNKVKPLVKRLLEKQNILKDYGKLAFIASIFVGVLVGFCFLMLQMKIGNIEKKVDTINGVLSGYIAQDIEKKKVDYLIEYGRRKEVKQEIGTGNLQHNGK